MTRAEREMMIGRYMSGGMSSAEEQEFFIQVAVDPELRIKLKAHRTVESAFRKDRDAEPAGHTALRGRISGMLAANPPQPAPVETPSIPRPTPPTAPAVPVAAGSAIGKWFAGAALVATLIVGSILLIPRLEQGTSAAPYRHDTVRMTPEGVDSQQSALPRFDTRRQEPTPDERTTTIETPETGASEQAPPSRTARPRTSFDQERTSDRPARNRTSASTERTRSAPERRQPVHPATALPDLDGARPQRNNGDSIDIGANIEVNGKGAK